MNKVFKLRQILLTRRCGDYQISFTHTNRIRAIEKVYDIRENTRVVFSDTRIDYGGHNTFTKGWQTLRS